MTVLALHTEPASPLPGASPMPVRKAISAGQLLIGRRWVDVQAGETMDVTDHDAIRLANDTEYGLASGIQTSDLGRALRLADRIKSRTAWLNTWHKHHPNAPFGGFKMSGYGREQGAEALENYTQYKTVWANQG